MIEARNHEGGYCLEQRVDLVVGSFGIDGKIGTDDDNFEYWPPDWPIE